MMRYSERIKSEAGEWISLQEAKNHVKALPDDADNELIENLIVAAREYAEGITGRSIAERAMTAYPGSVQGMLYLPKPPIKKVDSLTVFDKESNPHTFSDFTLNKSTGEIILNSMPDIHPRDVNPYEIQYTAGYDEIPAMMKQAMLLMVGHWYINRESVVVGSNATVDVGLTTKDLLRQYKVWWF